MADTVHLVKLKQGVDEWNAWRQEHPLTIVDLSSWYAPRKNLVSANLSGANLNDADLRQANLYASNFSDANLTGANLSNANLSSAIFARTNLANADLSGANLKAADLHQANLSNAEFWGANLAGVDLTEADLRGVKLRDANLCRAKLGKARLGNACFAGANLRGADLSGTDLDGADLDGANLSGTLHLYSCFISYSTQDQEFAERLYSDLLQKKIPSWFAPHKMQGGKKVHEQIDEAVRLSGRLLLILSEHSMGSDWVKTEIAGARRREVKERRRILFPIRLVPLETLEQWQCLDSYTGEDTAREIREYYLPDFSQWKNGDSYIKALARLVVDLKA